MERKIKINTDVVSLYIAIGCLLFAKLFVDHIYYDPDIITGIVDVFLFVYQYISFQLFFFCIMRPLGRIFCKESAKELSKKEKIALYSILLIYIIIVILFELRIIEFRLVLSPVKFITYGIFGMIGFLFGKRNL